jgi:hypothetical protein
MKNVNTIIFFIVQYFNRICIHVKAQKQYYICTVFILTNKATGLKSMAYIRFSKVVLKG